MKDSVSNAEQRAFLLAASAWQDTLLQSYRSLHVTIQGFIVAASSAVLAVQLTGAVQRQADGVGTGVVFNVVFSCLLVILAWLQRRTAHEFHQVVAGRAADIDYWHKATILVEQELEPSYRTFTHFKLWQHAHRVDVAHLVPRFLPSDGIAEPDVDALIGKGMGHTRRVVDQNLFARIGHLTLGIVLASLIVTLWFAATWWWGLG